MIIGRQTLATTHLALQWSFWDKHRTLSMFFARGKPSATHFAQTVYQKFYFPQLLWHLQNFFLNRPYLSTYATLGDSFRWIKLEVSGQHFFSKKFAKTLHPRGFVKVWKTSVVNWQISYCNTSDHCLRGPQDNKMRSMKYLLFQRVFWNLRKTLPQKKKSLVFSLRKSSIQPKSMCFK